MNTQYTTTADGQVIEKIVVPDELIRRREWPSGVWFDKRGVRWTDGEDEVRLINRIEAERRARRQRA